MVSRNYKEPSAMLAPFVERYWWTQIDAGTPLLPMDPGTGSEMIFHLSEALQMVNGSDAVSLPDVSLLRLVNERLELHAQSSVLFISVRFRTGMIRHFLPGGTVSALAPVVDAEELWGDSLSRLYDTVLQSGSIGDSLFHIEQFLLSVLSGNHKSESRIDQLASLLYYSSDFLTVQEIADHAGYSRRQLQRICVNSFGVTPKVYRSTVRFNRVKKNMLLSEDGHYLSHALDCGYYDQAHFIHEFSRFTTMTPGDYFRDYCSMVHFYKESLPVSKQIASGVLRL